MAIAVKICGLDREEAVMAAVDGGAAYVGFVFYDPSPRNLSPELAAELTALVPKGITRVGLFVDPEDDALDRVLRVADLDLLQLHGAEMPARVVEIKGRTGLPAMKAVPLASEDDLSRAAAYAYAADRLLFDAKPPAGMTGALPGGNALAFDWRLLAGVEIALPWMLAGGLTADNLAEAVAVSGAKAVDVSSGVEDAPGHKDIARIHDFLDAAQLLP